MIHQEKAIEPLWETKPDFEIYDLLATGMGHPEAFAFGREGMMRAVLDTETARKLGLTLENLREKHAVRTLPSKPFYIESFLTPTGKAQFFNVAPKPAENFGQEWNPEKERLPYWEPPHEAWPKNELFKKYPFYLVDEKARQRVHSQWWEVDVLKEVFPEPFVAINAKDAEPLGIKTGDIVKVYNDRGYMVAKARIHNGLKPGVLSTPKGWEKHHYIDGSFQELTSAVSSPMVANFAYSDKLVNIEKVK
jgi:molybdopterin-containing oxidoreductase family molybdopterin binding subunit